MTNSDENDQFFSGFLYVFLPLTDLSFSGYSSSFILVLLVVMQFFLTFISDSFFEAQLTD